MGVPTAGRLSADRPMVLSLAALLAAQNSRWDAGDRVTIDTIIVEFPELAEDSTLIVPLIVNEWMLWWDAGEQPNLAEYQARFPRVADELARQFRAQVAFERADPTDSYTQRTKEYAQAADDPFTLTLSGYRLIGEVGSGGMGVVYRAEQLSLGRTVAVKFLLAGRAAREGQVERFVNEGRLLARLDHPNVVRVIEVGAADHSPYIVMEFVDGQTLARQAAGRLLPVAEAVRWVELLARAVAYCHEQGVLHRDLKPANVLVTTAGVPKLTDFGLAKALDPDDPGHLTRTGDVMGTPSYMAPEQAAGRPPARPTDVYGLGAILYELLTGRPPFEGSSTLDVMKKVLDNPVRSPRQWRPDLPRDVETICQKCLEKSPSARYPTAAALADDLRRVQLGESISARPVGLIERGWRWCRRNRRVAIPAAAVFLTLLTATAVSLGFANEANRQAGRAEGNATAAQQQRDAAVEARWRGMLNEVVGLRHGQRPGQRSAALAKLGEALALAREGGPLSTEDRLRFSAEATSAYGLTELIAAEEWDGWPDNTRAIRFSPDLSRYARLSATPVELRSAPTGELLNGFKTLNTDTVVLPNGTDHLFTIRPNAEALGYQILRRIGPNAEKRWSNLWECKGVKEICIRADGKLVAFNRQSDGQFILVDGETNEVLHQLKGDLTALGHGAFHPTKSWVLCRRVAETKEGLVVVDTSTGKVVREQWVDFFTGRVGWHPDGRQFAVAGDDRTVRVFDDRLNEQYPLPFRNTSGDIQPVYSPSGEYLITHDWSCELRVCDGTSGRLLLLTAMPMADALMVGAGNSLAPERDGTALRQHRLLQRSVRSLALAPLPDDPFGVLVWNQDRTLFVANHGPNYWECVLHDGQTGKVLAELPHYHIPLWFEPNGVAVVTVMDNEPDGKPDELYRWPVNCTARTIGPPEPLRQQARFGIPGASSDRSVVVFGHVVYQNGLARPPASLDLRHQRGVQGVRVTAVSPDGRWAVLCSHGQGNCCLYDLRSMKWQAELWTDAGHAAFSPDGSTLAVFGHVGGRLYRVSDWGVIRDLPGNQGVYTPEGKLLAVSGATRGVPVGTIELIEAATGRTVTRFEHPTRSRVDPVGFGPDPAMLYMRVRDTRTLDVWDLRDVRRRLKAEFALEWDWPEFPPPPESPADPKPWAVKGVIDWNRWIPKVDRVDWNLVLPQHPPPSPPKDR